MKNVIFAKLAGTILALAIVNSLNAQNTNDVSFESVKYLQAGLNAGSSNVLENPSTPYSADAHSKAIKDFAKSFKGATARWSAVSDGFIANFNESGVKTAVSYNKSGIWQHTIRYYGEKELPADVRSLVKSSFYDASISQVEEITMSDKTIFLVHIEDNSSRKLIRVCDGEMQTLVNAKKD